MKLKPDTCRLRDCDVWRRKEIAVSMSLPEACNCLKSDKCLTLAWNGPSILPPTRMLRCASRRALAHADAGNCGLEAYWSVTGRSSSKTAVLTSAN